MATTATTPTKKRGRPARASVVVKQATAATSAPVATTARKRSLVKPPSAASFADWAPIMDEIHKVAVNLNELIAKAVAAGAPRGVIAERANTSPSRVARIVGR